MYSDFVNKSGGFFEELSQLEKDNMLGIRQPKAELSSIRKCVKLDWPFPVKGMPEFPVITNKLKEQPKQYKRPIKIKPFIVKKIMKKTKPLNIPIKKIKENEELDKVFDFESDSERHEWEKNKATPTRQDIVFKSDNVSIQQELTFTNLKNFIDKQKLYFLNESQKNKKDYACKYCGEFFDNGCALGGHVSKLHRGMTPVYKKSIFRPKRKKNEEKRNLFLRRTLESFKET